MATNNQFMPWHARVPVSAPEGRISVSRRIGPLLAWFSSLTVALVLLVWLGGGQLAAPDLSVPSSWAGWAAARSPAEISMAVMRIVALPVAWYLLGVTSVTVLAYALRAVRLARIADALSVGPIRTVVQQALGVSLAAGVLASTVPASGVGAAGTGATVALASASDVALVVEPRPVSAAVEVMVPIPAPVPAPDPAPVPAPAPTPVPSRPAVPVLEADVQPSAAPAEPVALSGVETERTYRVVAGDHLWSIAAADLAGRLGQPVTDSQIAQHHALVVELNRDSLVVPGNPDLIHPGQLMQLPPVAAGVTP